MPPISMPLNGCSSGLLLTALVALLLLPAQYYVPDLYSADEQLAPAPSEAPHSTALAWFDLAFTHLPPLDLFFTISLVLLAFFTYICEWIQRKLMERRILKESAHELNQYLSASVERLRAWDLQQEQLEGTLKMVQNATCEYNLLLYLLLRQHRCLQHAANGPPSNCFFDKEFDEDLPFLRNAAMDAQPV